MQITHRGISPVGIAAVVRGNKESRVVPIVYSSGEYIYWPDEIDSEEELVQAIQTVRSAIVTPVLDDDAGAIATSLDIPYTEARRIMRLLGSASLHVYLGEINRLRDGGINPQKMPYRYALPMLVRRLGNKAAEAIFLALSHLPVHPHTYGGDVGAREFVDFVIRVWQNAK